MYAFYDETEHENIDLYLYSPRLKSGSPGVTSNSPLYIISSPLLESNVQDCPDHGPRRHGAYFTIEGPNGVRTARSICKSTANPEKSYSRDFGLLVA